MNKILLLSLVTASISFTVTEMRLFRPAREFIRKRSVFLSELTNCGYCFGHWVAFALTAVYRPRLFLAWPPLDYFLTALIIAWIGAFQWILMSRLIDKAKK